VILARNSPGARFTSVDVSERSIAEAEARTTAAGLANVRFQQADIFALPFEPASFDHVFVCFVLEHVSRPLDVLAGLERVLKPQGSLTVIEGDHGSVCFHPTARRPRGHPLPDRLQRGSGGNALIGRQLYPLMREAGFGAVRVSPRIVYADPNRPDLVDGSPGKPHGHDRRRSRARPGGGLSDPERFDAGGPRPATGRRSRRRVLLHVLQGDGGEGAPRLTAHGECGRTRYKGRVHHGPTSRIAQRSPMSIPAVLAPVFVQILLTFVLLLWMGRARFAAVRSGAVKAKDIALGERAWPPRVTQVANAFGNQFETPVLFYALVAFALLTRKADLLFVLMSWAYVLSRLAHAYVYATTNTLLLRFRIFLAGTFVLMAMWIVFAARILVSGA
jgi:SAM-dependent methyltransferase